MPTVIGYHHVKDKDHWLASPKREEFFGPLGVTNIRTFVDPARLLQPLAATRPESRHDPELRGSLLALRSIARRVLQLTAEERELAREIETLTRKLAPQLLEQPGVGPHAAAQLVLSWSHPGRIDSEAAFARLAGAAPIPASSG